MPQLQVVDLSPTPRTQETPLEKTLGAFFERKKQNDLEKKEGDALKDIYDKYQTQGKNIEEAIFDINRSTKLGPTAKANQTATLLELRKQNQTLQAAQAKENAKAAKADATKQQNQQVLTDLETRRGLLPGALNAYADDPKMAEQVTRPAKEPKKTQASQPIDEDQLKRIEHITSKPEFQAADLPGKNLMLIKGKVSKENADAITKYEAEQAKLNSQAEDTAYKGQEKFINDTTNSYKGFETEMKPRLLQMQNIPDEDLITPTQSVFLDALGIPLGALEDPSSELYQKLSQDLLKGLPETYGNRILKVEVDNFLKTIPTLLNSPDGRRMIASNMLKLGEMKEVYYSEMRNQQKSHLESKTPLPRDFQQKIFDQVKPQIDRINNEFVKMSEVKSVPKGTIPFFNPSGDIEFVPKEHAQWASENGGRRIW